MLTGYNPARTLAHGLVSKASARSGVDGRLVEASRQGT